MWHVNRCGMNGKSLWIELKWDLQCLGNDQEKKTIHFWCVKSNKCTDSHTAEVARPNFHLLLEELLWMDCRWPQPHVRYDNCMLTTVSPIWQRGPISPDTMMLFLWCSVAVTTRVAAHRGRHVTCGLSPPPSPFSLTTSQRPAECMRIGQCGQTRLNTRQHCLFRSPTTWIWNTFQLLIDTTSAHYLLCMAMCIILLSSALSV